MEQGTAIAKSDPRIVRVRTTNTPGGAQVRMAFRDGVPGYRVRLRRDYVELLISAPEEKPKAAAGGAKTGKDTKEAKPAKDSKASGTRGTRSAPLARQP